MVCFVRYVYLQQIRTVAFVLEWCIIRLFWMYTFTVLRPLCLSLVQLSILYLTNFSLVYYEREKSIAVSYLFEQDI